MSDTTEVQHFTAQMHYTLHEKGVCFVSMRRTMMAKLDRRILWSASVGGICFTQIALMSGSNGLSVSCDVSSLSRTAHMLK